MSSLYVRRGEHSALVFRHFYFNSLANGKPSNFAILHQLNKSRSSVVLILVHLILSSLSSLSYPRL